MVEEPEKRYLSASQIKTWQMCARRWAYAKEMGLHSPGSGATTQGRGVHHASEMGYMEVIDGRPLPSAAELQDEFEADFVAALDAGMQKDEWAKDRICLGCGEKRDDLIREGRSLVKELRDCIMVAVEPVAVEERYEISLGDDYPFDLLGFVDVRAKFGCCPREVIRDTKCRSKKRGVPKKPELMHDLQLTMYSLMYRVQHQRVEEALILDCVVKGHEPPVAEVCATTRTNDDIQWLLACIDGVARGIIARAFSPCSPDNWWCSVKWCPYWSLCKVEGRWPK